MAVTFPTYQRPCGWNTLLPDRNGIRTLDDKVICDVVIIGAGYTGLSAARRWAENSPDEKVVVLESSTVGEGSPGRNSGFLLEITLASDADTQYLDRMHECNRLIAATMQRIVDASAHNSEQCDLRRTGLYRAAAGENGQRALASYQLFLDAAELPYETLNREDLRRRVGTEFYQAGIFSPYGYLVQPAALIRSIADQLPDRATLYEKSPALELRRVDSGWRVRTPAGQVTASKVVVANNSFAKALGIGKSRVATIYTYAGLSEPLSKTDLSQLGSEEAWGLLPTHRLGSTFRRTSDGRILVRSFYDYEAESDNKIVAHKLMDCVRSRYPALAHIRLANVWGGATGITGNGAPLWGESEPGLYVSVGCNGGGVVKGTLFGHLLADLAHGRGVPDLTALFGTASWMPGEPFRRIGFNLIASLEQRRGRAEV